MTAPLEDRIKRHIQMNGPLPLAEYMHWCLADKTHGYYQTSNVFGRSGDFVTAPEISQMFGELIGVWLIKTWETLGRPAPFNLVELGPGNGTLMNDVLRSAKLNPDFLAASRIRMIETSEQLTDRQRETLTVHMNVAWHKSIDELEDMVTLFIANEFLDALPFRQYVKSDGKWRERCVALDDKDALTTVLGAGLLEQGELPKRADKEPDGAVFEVSTIREGFVARISEHLAAHGGAALIIDYGHVKSGFGDTFQAIASHEFTDPFAAPGNADLTSHVDFEPLAKIAEASGCTPMPVQTQGEFLLALGLLERAGALGAGKAQDVQVRLKQEAERLALPDQMGDLFKVLAISTGEKLWPFAGSD